MSSRDLWAYLDESQSNQTRDPDTYLLAATVCTSEVIETVRDQVAPLRLKGTSKLHWHDESHSRRRKVSQAIADLPLSHVVVIRNGLPNELGERRRKLCLERMLYELDTAQVGTATFESRGPADDRRDRHTVDIQRSRQAISADLRVEHQKGPLEAMLWVPDAICGALTSHRMGKGEYLKIIEQRVEVRIVTVAV